jgi:hypothetical protein
MSMPAVADAAHMTGRLEVGGDAGGLWLHEADDGAARELRRADTVFPFTPDTFLDELVGLCVSDDAGAGLTATQFRALPAPAKSAIAAALLRRHAGAGIEAAEPRGPNESDAAFLLRAWRLDPQPMAQTQTPPAFDANSHAPANDAAPAIIAAAEPAAAADAKEPAAPVVEMVETPAVAARTRRPQARGALMLATMACLLAVATLGVSMVMLLRQDGVNQAMMQSVRQQQEQMLAASKANDAAIAALTAEVRALHPAASAATTRATPSADAAPNLRTQLRTASTLRPGRSRARSLPPIYPDNLRQREADEFP